MAQYIDKDALVAEIKRLLDKYSSVYTFNYGATQDLNHLLSFVETLGVEEVDLDKSARYYLLHEHISPLNVVLHQADLKVEMQYHKDIEDAYKAGFELGLKAQKGK